MTQPLLLDGVTAQQIFDDNVSDLKLSWIGGLEGADRTFPPEAVKAAAASSDLVGHLNLIHPSRIQIFGEQEVDYHEALELEQKQEQIFQDLRRRLLQDFQGQRRDVDGLGGLW